MIKSIAKLIPDPQMLCDMSPEELAGPLLACLKELQDSGNKLNQYDFSLTAADEYPPQRRAEISFHLMEAWSVLEREGLIARYPKDRSGNEFITRKGQRLAKPDAYSAYRVSAQLPRDLLNPKLLSRVWPAFARGEYDTAVFEAFKEVEVCVRNEGGFTDAEYGTDLMRQAFNVDVDKGSLTDPQSPKAERQALSDLFAGAIGSYKNPHSHRRVAIQSTEAAQMIILASHLLSIIDSRKVAGKPK